MENIDAIHFLIFVIPGFAGVWTFRYFNKPKAEKAGDFEYLGLSFVWGIIMLVITEEYLKWQNVSEELRNNTYYIASSSIFITPVLGWLGSLISHTKQFKSFIVAITPENILQKISEKLEIVKKLIKK